MPITKTIDPTQLRELASNPDNGIAEICAGLGMRDPTMYQQFKKHPELKQIYSEARAIAKAARNGSGTVEFGKESARKPRRSTRAAVAPPRKQRAAKKSACDPDFARKLLVEFEFIDLYGEGSPHFDELRNQLADLT